MLLTNWKVSEPLLVQCEPRQADTSPSVPSGVEVAPHLCCHKCRLSLGLTLHASHRLRQADVNLVEDVRGQGVRIKLPIALA